jgi:hypothetical protein
MSFKEELIIDDENRKEQRRTDRLFEKTLLETNGNRVCVGEQGSIILKKQVQPHNYRLYFHFDRKTFNPTQAGFDFKNHKSAAHAKELFNDCKIIIRKKTAEVTYVGEYSGRYINIFAASLEDCDRMLSDVVDYLDNQCIIALKELIRQYGGFSTFEYTRSPMQENGIKLDDYIDSIPQRMVIKDFPYFKKVYEKKVETYTMHNVRTFMRNRIIEQVAPEISQELIELRKEQNLYAYLTSFVKHRTDLHEALKNEELCNEIRKLCTDNIQRERFEQYLFTLEE